MADEPAHPRRCGENGVLREYFWAPGGSSPQVRGKLGVTGNDAPIIRLIPAGAGKTIFCFLSFQLVAAHPRRCGENL